MHDVASANGGFSFPIVLRRHVWRSRSEKEPLDNTSGSDLRSLCAGHSHLPLRREIPEHGSDQQCSRDSSLSLTSHPAEQVHNLVHERWIEFLELLR
jgi:hypothetical protein